MKRYTDVKQLIRDIDSLTTQGGLNSAVAFAVEKYALNGLVSYVNIDPDEKSHMYTPEMREAYFGEVTPMTCRSNPSYTGEAPPPEEIKIFTYQHENALEVCYTECTPDSLEQILTKKHRQIAMNFGKLDWELFWYGYAQNGIYGLTNHPNAADQAVSGVDTDWSGKTWADMTVDEILKEMRALTYDYSNPIIAMSEKAFYSAFGKLVSGSECSAIMTCLTKLINSMPGLNFTADSIKAFEILNGLDTANPNEIHHGWTDIGGTDVTEKNMLVVYDGDAVNYRSSAMQALGAGMAENTKYAKAIRWKATQGVVIEKTDSVRVRYGV